MINVTNSSLFYNWSESLATWWVPHKTSPKMMLLLLVSFSTTSLLNCNPWWTAWFILVICKSKLSLMFPGSDVRLGRRLRKWINECKLGQILRIMRFKHFIWYQSECECWAALCGSSEEGRGSYFLTTLYPSETIVWN